MMAREIRSSMKAKAGDGQATILACVIPKDVGRVHHFFCLHLVPMLCESFNISFLISHVALS